MSSSDAWLLDCGESLAIAVGDHEMLELVQTGQQHQVSASPEHDSGVLQWQGGNVPVMEISSLHNGARLDSKNSYLCLLNYQASSGAALQQLALRITRAPERIQVDDAQLCEFPREYDESLLKAVTLSCFTHHAKPVLILDIASLCSSEFQDQVSHSQNVPRVIEDAQV